MPDHIRDILAGYVEQIKRIYTHHLKQVVLYGSYARGDANEHSDIDIMILVDLSDMDIKEYDEPLSVVTFDINLDHDIWIMPIVKNIDHFDKWVDHYPFYSNVERDGVKLYAA